MRNSERFKKAVITHDRTVHENSKDWIISKNMFCWSQVGLNKGSTNVVKSWNMKQSRDEFGEMYLKYQNISNEERATLNSVNNQLRKQIQVVKIEFENSQQGKLSLEQLKIDKSNNTKQRMKFCQMRLNV